MPPGRPPKRSGDGISSSLDSSSGVTKAKLPRLEKSTEDFSSVVKSKLSSYSRTGQACDRCKVRKIRCDALANGCTNCTQQSLECYVTDRVTGRTERRGYLQQLEREKTSLLGHIRDLEKLLEDKGVHVRPWQSTTSAYTPEPSYDLKSDQSSKDFWPQSNSLWDKDLKNDGLSLTGMGGGARPIDSHLGIARDYTSLSSIDGTRLSILGTTIDITSFDAPDIDDPPAGASLASPVYNKSAQSFFNSVSKAHPPIEIPLPPRDEAFNYSEWFFLIIGVFIPVLHKPTYIELLSRLYDDPDFKPTKAELAIVHMVFAMMYYQFGCRDGGDSDKKARFNDISNRHYHWCVNKMWDLIADNSLASVQALILMAIHCRGFPKPGPAFVMCSLAWNRAIEFNLHRQYLNRNEPTTLENEMRKRAFWSIFSVMVMLCGRLGRPMPIRPEDIDVDYPIAIPDECLTEQGITNPGRIGECSWMVGLAGFKLVPLFLETWNNVHPAQQDPIRYVEAVRRVEQGFQAYQRDIEEQVLADMRKNGNVVPATYLESAGYELLMCLRHPSRCATSDPAFLAADYAVCEDMARKLLRNASDLAKLKSLDTTWYQIAVYVTAIFMLLACRWNKRAETTAADLTDLKEYVGMGMAVVSEILNYVGASDAPVIEQITTVIDRTVASIEQEMRTNQRGRSSTKPHLPSSRGAKHHDDYGSQTRRGQGRAARSTSRTPGPSSLSVADQMPIPRMSGIPSTSFYSSPLTQLNTDYSQMGYPELGTPAPTTSAGGGSYTPMSEDSAHHQYLYATSAGASSAAAQMVHSTPGSSPQSATTQHNPMVAAAYGSQAAGPGPSAHGHPHAHAHAHSHPHHQHAHQHPQHMAGSSAGTHWMPVPSAAAAAAAGSTWSQWTHAVVDPSTQDRYSASTLMNPLGGGGGAQRGEHGDAGAGAGTGGALAGVQQAGGHTAAAQWPMVVYHQSHVSGG